MHEGIRDYVRKQLPKIQGRILEVGSADHNGSVSDIVPNAIRTDMHPGTNVDYVCPAELLPQKFGEESFDTVISLDAFEHMADWRSCLTGMWLVLKTGGWMVMTMAGLQKRYHGYPGDYQRADWDDIKKIFPNVEDCEGLMGISMGWTAKKEGPLPDLSKIELKKVKR